jgi:phage gpG-like protein
MARTLNIIDAEIASNKLAKLMGKRAELFIKSPILRNFIKQISVKIKAKAKYNIQTASPAPIRGRTGRLVNAIMYDINQQQGVISTVVAARRVEYAAINEFGYTGMSDAMIRAMFANMSAMRLKSKKYVYKPKGIVSVKNRTWKARPYLIPAYKEATKDLKSNLIDLIRAIK